MSKLFVDGNNIFIRSLFSRAVLPDPKSDQPHYELWKYLMFSHIVTYVERFKPQEVIVAMDGRRNWRYIKYPNYKWSRKIHKDESHLDWSEIYSYMNQYIKEFQSHLPFKILEIDLCEADDIIATLAQRFGQGVIVSTDSDFRQLLTDKIKQFNPFTKDFYTKIDNIDYLCLVGLSKDDIPNIMTPLNWDINSKKRRPPFGEKKAKKVLEYGLEKWLEENNLKDRFTTRKLLIDYTYIPETVQTWINEAYDDYKLPDPTGVLGWLYDQDWKRINENITYIEQKLLSLYGNK